MTSFQGEGSRVLTGLMVEKEMVNGKYKNDLEKKITIASSESTLPIVLHY